MKSEEKSGKFTPQQLQVQKTFFEETVKSKELDKGETWFLLDTKWYKQWKRYVGYDSWDLSDLAKMTAYPGPVDNSNLLQPNGTLKENLIDELDYMLIPENAWEKLMEWYGLMNNQQPLARKVIEQGMFVKHRKVEVYPLLLKLSKYAQGSSEAKEIMEYFSRTDPVETIFKKMRTLFDVPTSKEARLWNKYMSNTYEQLSNMDVTVADAGFYQGQVIVIEEKNDDGSWPRQDKNRGTTSSVSPSASVNSGDYNNSIDATPSSSTSSSYYTRSEAYYDRRNDGQVDPAYGSNVPGTCGLGNLGNTCFMNSSLQAMSNVPQLSAYFQSEKWRKELNPDNPLGCNGEMAKAFADLMRTMWSGRHTYTMPRHFKVAVGHFAPQFSGYQQHDGQELMAFLLDGLHEDLNRIKKKPYIELKDADGRADELVAHESWSNYQKRNDSIIVDIFHGLLKSTLTCPVCDKISVTFDPFCYLTLPMPGKKDRSLKIFFVSLDPSAKPVEYNVLVPRDGYISDLYNSTSRVVKISANKLIAAEVYNHRFHKFFHNNDLLNGISERDYIYIFESKAEKSDSSVFMLPVYFKMLRPEENPEQGELFGRPMVIPVGMKNCTYETIHKTVVNYMRRFVQLPEDYENWDSGMSKTADKRQHANHTLSPSDDEMDGVRKTPPIFSMAFVNSSGSNEVSKIDPMAPINFSRTSYLCLNWHPRARELFFDAKIALETEKDTSVFTKPARQAHYLTDCIELFTKEEQLGQQDPWYCPRCKEHQQAYKKFDLWQLPPVLVIHLKRFSYSRVWRDKIDTMVEFPTRHLDMKPWVINKGHEGSLTYDLIGVCNHYGGLGGGHYTAYAKNKTNDKWYHFDDSSVMEVQEDSVVTKAGYVLVYKRHDLSTGVQMSNGQMNGTRDEDMDTN